VDYHTLEQKLVNQDFPFLLESSSWAEVAMIMVKFDTEEAPFVFSYREIEYRDTGYDVQPGVK
jgi:hypothetical protein